MNIIFYKLFINIFIKWFQNISNQYFRFIRDISFFVPKASSSNWFICFGVIGGLKRVPGFLSIFFAKMIHHCYQWDMSAENPLICQHVQKFQRNNQNKCWCLPKNPRLSKYLSGVRDNVSELTLNSNIVPPKSFSPLACVSASSQVILCSKCQVAAVHRTMSLSPWIEFRLFRHLSRNLHAHRHWVAADTVTGPQGGISIADPATRKSSFQPFLLRKELILKAVNAIPRYRLKQ